jgi:hypothetical protein
MNTLITFLAGIAAGMYLSAQTTALKMPVFHLPKTIHIDPVVILLGAVVVLAIMAARGKHNPRRAGK